MGRRDDTYILHREEIEDYSHTFTCSNSARLLLCTVSLKKKGNGKSGYFSKRSFQLEFDVFAGNAVKIESKTEYVYGMGLKASGSVAELYFRSLIGRTNSNI